MPRPLAGALFIVFSAGDPVTKQPRASRGPASHVLLVILSLKGLKRDEISCGVYGHIYL